ncbi:MAG: endolytic transglycosylase MltG [Thermodesulfobacteriota bacterium]|nr:endolytic transglycosylase MltG [Thermodesulfobacteriota bacterium]
MKIQKLIKVLLAFFLLLAASFLLLSMIFLNYVESPVEFIERYVTVEIPPGASFYDVTDILRKKGLIRYKEAFYFLALVEKAPERIKAGEYELTSSMSPSDILDKLVEGKVKGYRVPIPEGFTIRQIAARLAANRLADEKRFIDSAHDEGLISSLDIKGESVEGYLFPDTYVLSRSMGEEKIIRFMVAQLRRKITFEMSERMGEIGLSMREVLTLASIIEKEGGSGEEKPLISAVFHNRLKRGMKLQSDPTVIYDIEDFDGNITKKHLVRKTPYNTYRIRGLPPGPICNPGMDAIVAALYPAPVNYLYFVSKNNGAHQFSSNLSDHNKAVIRYQIKRK